MTIDRQPQPSQPQMPAGTDDSTGRPASASRTPVYRSQTLWRVVGSLASLALLVFLIRAQGWDEFARVLGRLPLYYFGIAFCLTLLSRFSVGMRWFTLLRSARVKMSIWQCQRLTFMGLFATNFLPTTIGGDLVRMAGTVYLRIDAGLSAASLVVDRLVGMTGMASLAPFGMAIVLSPVGQGIHAPQWSFSLLSGLARVPGVGWLYRKGNTFLRSLARSSVYWLRHPLSLVWALICTYGHMLFTFLAIWLLLSGMHQSISFWWIGALWSLNYFITTFVPISINGLGLQEVSIAYLYSHFGGVSMEAGLALAILMRMLQSLASLPGALFLPEILRPLPAIPKNVEENDDGYLG